ncbi:MAG: hypothetical protein KAG97_06895, partial [Victivallales bacterium]|nr:hypothetical protein [Victivallales bacterium]
DEHLEILDHLDDDCELTPVAKELVGDIVDRLDSAMAKRLGTDWMSKCLENLPEWSETPGKINIPVILRLWNLASGLDMIAYGKMRYNLLGDGGDWFPGENAVETARFACEIIDLLKKLNHPFPENTVKTLKQAHELLFVSKEKK